MNSTRQIIAKIGLILFLSPGLIFLIIEFTNKLGQSNPFIIAMVLIYGGLAGLVGFIAFLIADKGLKKKLILSILAVGFYVALLPVTWGINSIRERMYLSRYDVVLEKVANQILTDQITIEEANQILDKKDLIIHVSYVPEEKKHVLFLISGMIDNCYGFAYSLTDEEPSWNGCGDLTSWKKIKEHWYVWTTT